jgi:hypothetical protein
MPARLLYREIYAVALRSLRGEADHLQSSTIVFRGPVSDWVVRWEVMAMARVSSLLGCTFGFLCFAAWGGAARGDAEFLRGDANQDGKVSIADALTIRRFLYNGDLPPSCLDACDINDIGSIDISTEIGVLTFLFGGEFYRRGYGYQEFAAPFPEPGVDPTAGDEFRCRSYEVQPAPVSSDLIRIGEVTVSPGQLAAVPVYLTNSQPVEAIQLAITYDPETFRPSSDGFFTIQREGSPWEGTTAGGMALAYPAQRYFTVGLMGSMFGESQDGAYHPLPPGKDRLIFKIAGRVPREAAPGTVIRLEPTNGPDGRGVAPPYFLVNELSNLGKARLPLVEGGLVNIVADMSFFTRGDSNQDQLVNITDAVHVLDFLFLGGETPPCLDAADADDSGVVDLTDAVVILGYLFLGTATIEPPYPAPGSDTTRDDLTPCGQR